MPEPLWKKRTRSIERLKRRNRCERTERSVKVEAIALDKGRCRWPRCTYPLRPEGAHLRSKGMGGTPKGDRNTRQNIYACCSIHHRGERSIHSGDLHAEALTARGTDGPMEFYELRPGGDPHDDGDWHLVGRDAGRQLRKEQRL